MSQNFLWGQSDTLTIHEAVTQYNSSLAPKDLYQLSWIKGSNSFSFLDTNDNNDVLIIGSAEPLKQGRKIGATLDNLNDALDELFLNPLNTFPKPNWENTLEFSFYTQNKLLRYNLKTKRLTTICKLELEDGATNINIAPNTNYAAYTLNNNLFVFDGKDQLIVTNDLDKNLINGQSIYNDEFGKNNGIIWSPNGKLLAFYHSDETRLADYPIVDYSTRPATVKWIKYSLPGEAIQEVTLGIYDVETGQSTFLLTGLKENQYLSNISWGPTEETIYAVVLNREQNHLQVNSYDILTGLLKKTLFEESSETFIQPKSPIVFVPNQTNQFIWQSKRDGYNHLYLYDTDGNLKSQLTKGNWNAIDLIGFDENAEHLYYTSTEESPITENLYSVDLKKNKTKRITEGDGIHTVLLSDEGKYIIDSYESISVPRKIEVYNKRGRVVQGINEASNPLGSYHTGKIELLKIKSDSAIDLFCRMYKPISFDNTKKYPVIVYINGLPGSQEIKNAWNGNGNLWFQHMAQQGFVVFSLDNRGSANRSKEFEDAVYKRLGVIEMEDQMTGVNYLKSLSYIDTNRIGVMGNGYGGYIAISLMMHYPNNFKAGVTIAPIVDLSLYKSIFTERYMAAPESNLMAYRKANLLNYIDSLQGKLLLIHGTEDRDVLHQHSMLFLEEAIKKEKQIDYFTFPGQDHTIENKESVYLYQKIRNYFLENLKP